MDTAADRLKIAVQKSGRLTEQTMQLLERCGLKIRKSKDQLFCYGENMPIDLLLVRDDDIPGLVGEDVCDLGIAGLNVIEEKRLNGTFESGQTPFHELRQLGFGECRLSLAAPEAQEWSGPQSLEGRRIATSYPALTRDYLDRNGVGGMQGSESKYILLHAPRTAVAEITRILPGSEAPTILPLEGIDDRVAVHAVCREIVFWESLESLKAAGASSMLVLPVEKMLA